MKHDWKRVGYMNEYKMIKYSNIKPERNRISIETYIYSSWSFRKKCLRVFICIIVMFYICGIVGECCWKSNVDLNNNNNNNNNNNTKFI